MREDIRFVAFRRQAQLIRIGGDPGPLARPFEAGLEIGGLPAELAKRAIDPPPRDAAAGQRASTIAIWMISSAACLESISRPRLLPSAFQASCLLQFT